MGIIKRMWPSTYKIHARWFPAIMIALPAIILFSGLIYRFVPWGSIEKIPLKVFGAVPSAFMLIGFASIILFSEKIRNLGKHLEDEYFRKATAFPTTEFLLWSNREIDNEVKELLHKAISRDYGISLCSCEEEAKDVAKARRLICFAVNQIRESIKDGRLLIDYNIRYGYYRNILGAANWGMSCSTVCFLVSFAINSVCVSVGELILIFYFAWLIYKRDAILDEYSQEYARRLFSEYLMWSNARAKSK